MEVLKTLIFMTVLFLIFIFFGAIIAGTQGIIIAFCIAVGVNFFSYFFSDTLILKHYNAVAVSEENAMGLYAITKELCNKANLPIPKIYILPDPTPNAFATGRNPKNAAIAVTQGLLDLLSPNEIKGVIAHELSHIKHYDILTGSIAAIIAGSIAILTNFAKFSMLSNGKSNRSNVILTIIAVVVMPIVAMIIQMAISRTREYEADKGAALITNEPLQLANALRKLENYARNRTLNNANEQSAHMFIISPFSNIKNKLNSLFNTHPSTSERIARLQAMQINQ